MATGRHLCRFDTHRRIDICFELINILLSPSIPRSGYESIVTIVKIQMKQISLRFTKYRILSEKMSVLCQKIPEHLEECGSFMILYCTRSTHHKLHEMKLKPIPQLISEKKAANLDNSVLIISHCYACINLYSNRSIHLQNIFFLSNSKDFVICLTLIKICIPAK